MVAGIVYLTDLADGSLHAFPRESGRAVRIVRTGATGEPQGRTARVAVTKDELLELDPPRRSVVKRPRLVPAELVLRTESLSETLALWYAYLHDNGILPTRDVPHSRNVEATLRAQAALLAPYVRRLDPLMCALNRAHCAGGVLRPLREGDPLRIPDLPFERFADVETIELDGKTTLGQRVNALVPRESLASWSVDPRPYYDQRPGRWVAEPAWPPSGESAQTYWLNRGALDAAPAAETRLEYRGFAVSRVRRRRLVSLWPACGSPA